MAIKQLDQDSIDSIYNKLVFTSKPDSISVDKKSIVSMSNTLTDTKNYFNVLETSLGNIKKLNDFKIKRDKQLTLERQIEAVGPSRSSGLSGLSVDFSSAIAGFGVLAKQLNLLNEKLEELDFSSGSSDDSGESTTDDDDDDIDKKKKKRKKSRGSRRGRLPKLGKLGKLGGRALGIFGVGLDVADRVGEGQSATKVAVGVGGGLAGATVGAKAGAAAGAAIGVWAGGIGAVPAAAVGSLIGGGLGYFGGSALADKGYEEISKTSYSSKFADFLKGSISNVSAFVGGGGNFGGGGSSGDFTLDGVFGGGELPADAGVLDAIAKAEGTYGTGYNTSLGNGRYLPGGKEQNLTNKTLDEILQLQSQMLKHPNNKFNSSALGRYQIVSITLKDAAKALKLDTKTTKFTPEVQDRLAMWILKKQGFKAWEGFKKNPKYLQIAQTALKENRIKSAAPVKTLIGTGTLDTAKKWLGFSEGNRADSLNQFIRTFYGPFDVTTTPWCAAFVNAVLGSQGIQGTGSAMASSFRGYGSLVWDRDAGGDISAASSGDIGFFRRSSGSGHVAFIDNINIKNGTVTYVGGNQSDRSSGGQVSKTTIKIDDPQSGLIAVRRPGKFDRPITPEAKYPTETQVLIDAYNQNQKRKGKTVIKFFEVPTTKVVTVKEQQKSRKPNTNSSWFSALTGKMYY
jgi:uncharacterized protein (TIGR02594 family)